MHIYFMYIIYDIDDGSLYRLLLYGQANMYVFYFKKIMKSNEIGEYQIAILIIHFVYNLKAQLN